MAINRKHYLRWASIKQKRIDNNGNYCKENCKWADVFEQANNKRNNKILKFKGEQYTLSQWARKKGIKRSTLAQRIYVYLWSVEKSLLYNKKNI